MPNFSLLTLVSLLLLVPLSMIAAEPVDERARKCIENYLEQIKPLEIEVNRAWWDANVSGSDADFEKKEKSQNRLDRALADKEQFAELKELHKAKLSDPLLARQIEVLYLRYLEKQLDPALLERMTSKANAIEKTFNVYRAEVGEKVYTDSEVRQVLIKSNDSGLRRQVWEASKGVGAAVEQDLKDLVLLRNEAARRLGFKDFHVMQLELNEQKQQDVLKLFDELDELTREPFLGAKADIDRHLADQYKVGPDELRPWHYHDPFFQEAPSVYGTNLDTAFAETNIAKVSAAFFARIGLPVQDVIDKSSLYEQPGKSPHAFCTDIDREGDVRVLANIVPNEYWMSTMLHELGHAVYSSKNIPQSVPYLLRSDAHILTTEGVAMMFERFSKSADWLAGMGISVEDPQAYNEAGARMRRDKLLIFSRWCQVMLRFEVALYDNPRQDLNTLWWDLVERYQGVRRPDGRNAPDFASKIHVVSAPAYYHNYMMGQLFACQLHEAIAREVLKAKDPATVFYVSNLAVGEFMKQRVFEPGRTLTWNELTRHATGANLNAKAFAAEFSGR